MGNGRQMASIARAPSRTSEDENEPEEIAEGESVGVDGLTNVVVDAREAA